MVFTQFAPSVDKMIDKLCIIINKEYSLIFTENMSKPINPIYDIKVVQQFMLNTSLANFVNSSFLFRICPPSRIE